MALFHNFCKKQTLIFLHSHLLLIMRSIIYSRTSSAIWRVPPRYTMMPDDVLNKTKFSDDEEDLFEYWWYQFDNWNWIFFTYFTEMRTGKVYVESATDSKLMLDLICQAILSWFYEFVINLFYNTEFFFYPDNHSFWKYTVYGIAFISNSNILIEFPE